MRFLNALFWIVIAVLVTLFAARNWRDVTVDLWGNLQADFKIPILLAIAFAVGFLPTWLLYRARLWRVTNRVSMPRRDADTNPPAEDDPLR